ncbi:MAG: ROK family protein, partial [Acidobacteriota bacterium]
PFYFENAAKLSAVAEMWFSEREGRPLRDFVFVTVSGGLGTGVIINGQVLQGAYSAAAEFGHTTLYADGLRCGCGSTGCWEQYASDFALNRLYSELSEQSGAGKADVEASAIVRMAREGHPVARPSLEQTAAHVGTGFANLIWALNPEAIVVGDWLAEAWDLVEEIVWGVVRSRVAGYDLSGVRIFPSRHVADSSILGAVALVVTRFFTSFDPGDERRLSHSVVMSTQSAG